MAENILIFFLFDFFLFTNNVTSTIFPAVDTTPERKIVPVAIKPCKECSAVPVRVHSFPLAIRPQHIRLVFCDKLVQRWHRLLLKIQVVRLLQRDHAAGWVSSGQQWKTGTGRQYFTHIIGLSSTTMTQSACKAIEFNEKKTQNKGHYTVQGHSRLSRSVPIGSTYATS